jgi:hypothetical protein
LDIKKVDSSAIFYRTHLGNRHNATHLAMTLIRRAVEVEKTQARDDPLALEFAQIAEPWAISHILQGCFIEEYHQWEKAVKQYFKQQRELNGLSDDFDWKLGKRSIVEHVKQALSFFSASIDDHLVGGIDGVRRAVNNMKHDPLSFPVAEADYDASVRVFELFWERLSDIEMKSFG